MQFTNFLSRVLPFARNCPDALVMDHIIDAARHFCAKTLAWNYSCPTIASAAGIGTYTLQIGANEEVVRVLRVEVDGSEYSVPYGPSARAAVRRGAAGVCVFSGPDFTLSPAPSMNGLPVIADVAVKPAMSATEWPDDLSDHVTDIAHGAIASLCSIPGADWTNPSVAADQQAAFNQRIAATAMKVSRGMAASRQGSSVRWF